MSAELPYLPVRRLSGQETLHRGGQLLAPQVLAFWQWGASDLLGNTFRGWFAEFLVASDLGITRGTRSAWEGFDLQTNDGVRIEVKSSAYLQSWKQRGLSRPSFSVHRARAWDPRTDTYADAPDRNSDVYVFCLLHHTDKATVDPLDVTQWTFFVLSTQAINKRLGSRQSVTLRQLKDLEPLEAQWGAIASAIGEALARNDAA
jgi:hypothetical protein